MLTEHQETTVILDNLLVMCITGVSESDLVLTILVHEDTVLVNEPKAVS